MAPLHATVLAAGGLHIIGTERHESRRVDNQLRGRSGRQGDPGSSRFYLSLDDSLLRIFGGERLKMIMEKLKMPEGEAIEHAMVNRSLESAQRKVEQRNFDIRKQLLEYDDVANDQRKVIYQQRNELLETDDVSRRHAGMHAQVLNDTINEYIHPGSMAEQWDIAGLEQALAGEFLLDLPDPAVAGCRRKLDEQGLRTRIVETADQAYAKIEQAGGTETMRQFERSMLLQSLDSHWREHLAAMDHLRQGIHLRGYAAKNPKQEYKREAFELFERMLETIAREVTQVTLTVQIRSEADVEAVAPQETRIQRAVPPRRLRRPRWPMRPPIRPRHRAQPIERQFPKSAATIPAPAAPARSTSIATASWPEHHALLHLQDRPAQHPGQTGRGGQLQGGEKPGQRASQAIADPTSGQVGEDDLRRKRTRRRRHPVATA
jgi:preprotein translocase subunit SecA